MSSKYSAGLWWADEQVVCPRRAVVEHVARVGRRLGPFLPGDAAPVELVEQVVHRLMAGDLPGHIAVGEREVVVVLAAHELARHHRRVVAQRSVGQRRSSASATRRAGSAVPVRYGAFRGVTWLKLVFSPTIRNTCPNAGTPSERCRDARTGRGKGERRGDQERTARGLVAILRSRPRCGGLPVIVWSSRVQILRGGRVSSRGRRGPCGHAESSGAPRPSSSVRQGAGMGRSARRIVVPGRTSGPVTAVSTCPGCAEGRRPRPR